MVPAQLDPGDLRAIPIVFSREFGPEVEIETDIPPVEFLPLPEGATP